MHMQLLRSAVLVPLLATLSPTLFKQPTSVKAALACLQRHDYLSLKPTFCCMHIPLHVAPFISRYSLLSI